MCMERSLSLLHAPGAISMIVPLALVSTQRMTLVQKLIETTASAWYANFAWRPGKLFDTVNRALTIFVACRTGDEDRQTYSTNYQKWNSDTRGDLIPTMAYCEVERTRPAFWAPKLGSPLEQSILSKVLASRSTMSAFVSRSSSLVYYRTTGGLYWKVFTDFAPAFMCNGKPGHSSRETSFALAKAASIKPAIAVLSSDVFWWWYTITSNLRDLNPSDIQGFPVPASVFEDSIITALAQKYVRDLKQNSTMLVRQQKQTGKIETQSFKVQQSKHIIDEIDRALAKHYGFTDEELDFIINYDIKYRMGGADGGEDGAGTHE
ncbi:MAG: SAM-dependent methyltransferase, partial [Nanoarchaeota archaeon]|nr:SAM-dependent methyltransferase [Nanoarchaeota archaeon]